MNKLFFALSISVVVSSPSLAAVMDEIALAERAAELVAMRDVLRSDLEQIAIEKSRCERQKRNWRTATIVGGIGVAATVTGAIVQHNKNEEKKVIQKGLNTELYGGSE